MRVAVFGAGGLGSYFGGRLALGGAEVALIARGEQLAALRSDGLHVRSVRGDFIVHLPATDDPAEIGECDFVLVCVKANDTERAAAALAPLLGAATAIVSLQNGIDNEAKIAAAVGERSVMGGVARILATLESPGQVVDSGGPGSLLFGEVDGTLSERGRQLKACCDDAGVSAGLVTDIRAQLWRKFVFICALAGTTAAARAPIGDIRANAHLWRMFERIAAEVAALAAAEGVGLPADVVDETSNFAASLEPMSFSSLYHDLVNGRRLELDALHGFVVARSRAHALDAPANEAVYALLAPHAAGAETSGARGIKEGIQIA